MSKVQKQRVTPPVAQDTALKGFTTNIQNSIEALYKDAHDHAPRSTMPTAEEGQVGDMRAATDGTDWYIVTKISRTQWARSAALVLL